MEHRATVLVAEALADFVTGLDLMTIPPEVVEKASCCLVYGLGNGSIRPVLKHLLMMLEQSPFDNGMWSMPRPAK